MQLGIPLRYSAVLKKPYEIKVTTNSIKIFKPQTKYKYDFFPEHQLLFEHSQNQFSEVTSRTSDCNLPVPKTISVVHSLSRSWP